jgi:hypothetical protein
VVEFMNVVRQNVFEKTKGVKGKMAEVSAFLLARFDKNIRECEHL